jgi:hypothetical protein
VFDEFSGEPYSNHIVTELENFQALTAVGTGSGLGHASQDLGNVIQPPSGEGRISLPNHSGLSLFCLLAFWGFGASSRRLRMALIAALTCESLAIESRSGNVRAVLLRR